MSEQASRRANVRQAHPCILSGCGAEMGRTEAGADAILWRRSPSSFLSVSNEAAIMWVRREGVRAGHKGLMGRDTHTAPVSL